MRKIPLRARDGSIRAYALVDDDDYEWLSQWRWHLHVSKRHGRRYARHRDRHDGGTLMHCHILGTTGVDHINGDGLDNRRCNLRIASHAQNMQNRGPSANGRAQMRGVSWDEERQKWRATIRLNGRNKSLGRYDTAEEAALIAAVARREHMPYSQEASCEAA